jgi:hypothetical protein
VTVVRPVATTVADSTGMEISFRNFVSFFSVKAFCAGIVAFFPVTAVFKLLQLARMQIKEV